MRNLLSTIFVTAFLLLPIPTRASSPVTGTADQLMDISGISLQYRDIPQDVAAGLEEQRQYFEMLSDKAYEDMASLVISVFQPEPILARIREEIQRSLTEKEMQELMTWYESAAGRKITTLEVEASGRESHRRMMALKELQLTKTERVAFARRFDKLLNLTTFALEYYKIEQEAMIVAINQIMYPDQIIDLETWRRQASWYEQEVRKEAEELILVSVVYTYRALNDAELERYMEFNKQPGAVKLSTAVFNGALAAMRDGLEQLAQAGPVRAE